MRWFLRHFLRRDDFWDDFFSKFWKKDDFCYDFLNRQFLWRFLRSVDFWDDLKKMIYVTIFQKWQFLWWFFFQILNKDDFCDNFLNRHFLWRFLRSVDFWDTLKKNDLCDDFSKETIFETKMIYETFFKQRWFWRRFQL